MENVVRDELVV